MGKRLMAAVVIGGFLLAATSASADCSHGGSAYKKGGTFCKNKEQYECGSNDQWFKNGKACTKDSAADRERADRSAEKNYSG